MNKHLTKEEKKAWLLKIRTSLVEAGLITKK